MKKPITIITCMILLIVVMNISASLDSYGTYKQGDNVRLVQVCYDATWINISSIAYPNSTVNVTNTPMISAGSGEFYYNFNDTSSIGRYDVRGISDGCERNFATYFFVTYTGEDLTVAKSISYVLIFVISFIVFFALLIMGIYLPSGNNRNEMTGYIIAVSNIKYLKLLFLGLAYMMAVFISYFSWMISYAYMDMDFVSEILRIIFTILAVLVLPLFVLFIYLTIANLVRDSQIGESLSRGLRVR